eukprot:10664140-Lingulodinium_polyedra.AAC.1
MGDALVRQGAGPWPVDVPRGQALWRFRARRSRVLNRVPVWQSARYWPRAVAARGPAFAVLVARSAALAYRRHFPLCGV